MARKLRIESSEGLYHVINRGNYRSWIFETAGARTAFEATLGQSCVNASDGKCLLTAFYRIISICIGSRGFKKDLARDYFHNHGAIHMEHAELRELNELRWEGYLEASLKAL